MADGGRDFQLDGREWRPVAMFDESVDDENAELALQGWEEFLRLGDDYSTLSLQVWQRCHGATSVPEYVVQVGSAERFSPYLRVGTFPEVMDLIARWAPAVESALHCELAKDALDYRHTDGIVEGLAARATYGKAVAMRKLSDD